MFWKKKQSLSYDPEQVTPVLRSSICTGETVAGFKDNKTGKFTEDVLIRNDVDLEKFKKKYNITTPIEKTY